MEKSCWFVDKWEIQLGGKVEFMGVAEDEWEMH